MGVKYKMQNRKIGVHMVFDKTLTSEGGAILVFAFSQKELMNISRRTLKDLQGTASVNVVSRKLKKNLPFLLAQADQEKLAIGEGHAIVYMDCCPECGLWGEEWPSVDETCGYCGFDPLLG